LKKQSHNNLIPNFHIAIDSLRLNSFERMWANFEEDDGSKRVIQSIKDGFNTDKKYEYYEKDGYHIIDNIPTETVHKDKEHLTVEYKYNSDFFRSDHFKKEHDGLHIVFTGCSNTEGVGLNINQTWSHMLHSRISEKIKTSGYFNLGKGGCGWHNIISNFQVYVNDFGAPDILFVLHPNILRGYDWDNNFNDRWSYSQTDPVSKETINNQKLIELHKKNFLNWVVAWNLFIRYCESLGTKVLWSTWDFWENQNIIDLGFFNDTYISIPPEPSYDLIMSHCPDGKCKDNDIHARDGHPGFLTHKTWYNGFWKELLDRGWIDD
jgi:hypothetical protein